MSAHTPGPWSIKGRIGQHEEGAAPIVAGQQIIAYAEAGTLPDIPVEANARLIAAAPELLRIAELAVKCALQRPHDGNQLDEDMEGLLLEARAAIKKARGES